MDSVSPLIVGVFIGWVIYHFYNKWKIGYGQAQQIFNGFMRNRSGGVHGVLILPKTIFPSEIYWIAAAKLNSTYSVEYNFATSNSSALSIVESFRSKGYVSGRWNLLATPMVCFNSSAEIERAIMEL